ncbi:UDP-N-acetylglucosamine--N-acetylmuramyl-(pentapeptide) pyrophosphoryl-undecaprenol N-acetylglucosamine transferase [Candidatus Bilamarchaeum dharawalense]|uniref:UDP-N-acetylglucosamine--N-acetylmuramyl-(Pentapeptide) pyrophosphoryl-undecaprenol N-acetylglucosamine transferase n=1 Tax=Candidatus Bilamarchaeum dharawalense TaxID=2885759 RepID=A0A5E4LSE6_9ARCH|nr:UDP-N-acetylglucosamine--N-acetylmuramyl-(pentapeptide) pyrophosphoryl-undecaprenol N-acetylglucosamine transferase [Candidatus Bilamarchaeum dharawalense]
MVRIGFRLNANFKTGSGHLQRCLALASGLKETNSDCEIFFLTSSSSDYKDKIIDPGFVFVDLGPVSTTHENLEATKDAIKHHELKILVVDSYEIDENFMKTLKKEILLVVFDDFIHLKSYHSHILVNPTAYAHTLPYQCDEDTKLFLGTEFVQIRKEFDQYEDFERQNPEQAKHVLVSFGGSDPKGATLLTVKALKSLPNPFSVSVVVGKTFKNSEALAKEIGLDSRFIVLQDISDISKKMAMCDLAIVSPSTTFYELAFFRIPTILIVQADNQEMVADYAGKNELAISLGDIRHINYDLLANTISALIQNRAERDRMSARLDDMVDGLGRFRLAEEILKLYKEKTETI